MKLHELRPAEGSNKERRRLGRGTGSGIGKTSGKGHKGQKARSGGGKGPHFEGGQTPLSMRVPKRGFKNVLRKEFSYVNTGALNEFDNDTEVTPELLVQAGLIKDLKAGVKVLAKGDLEKKLTVKAQRFSQAAIAKIEAAGGRVEVV